MWRIIAATVVLLSTTAQAGRGQVVASNDTADGSIRTAESPAAAGPVIAPLRPELDAPDAKQVLMIQVQQHYWRAETEKARAAVESQRVKVVQAEKELSLWNKEMQNAIDVLQKRYNCPGCSISQEMRWMIPETERKVEESDAATSPSNDPN